MFEELEWGSWVGVHSEATKGDWGAAEPRACRLR